MDELIQKCITSDNIIIYGAGAVANITYCFLLQNDISNKFLFFCVSHRDNNPLKLHEKDVVCWDECSHTIPLNSLIIIATKKMHMHDIINGIKRDCDCEYYCVDSDFLISDFYNTLYKNPINPNKIIFTNMSGMKYGGNPKYVAQKLIEVDKDGAIELVWASYEKSDEMPNRIRFVEYESLDYYYDIATSAVWVDNCRKNSDIRKREGQYYIQTWHGAAPFKKVEKDAIQSLSYSYVNSAINDSQMSDLFISGSKFYSKLYKSSFWYDGAIMETGLPRHDILFNNKGVRDKIFRRYNISQDNLFVLYSPTFRKSFDMRIYDIDFDICEDALKKRFGKDIVFGISKHPANRYLKYCFEYDLMHIDVSDYEDFEELLIAADILISDYSGCVYDYSFLERPIFLYQPDYREYIKERDFYIPMEKLPYPRAKTNQGLCDIIRNFDYDKYKKNIKKFMNSMINYDTGNASEKVAMRIMDRMKKKPIISIIVPIYNVISYLPDCINSLKDQVDENVEIILIDDGSTDGCGELCDRLLVDNPKIKVIHKSNGGLVSARKEGISIALGEYITFVDADDWVDSDLVKILTACIIKNNKPDVIAYGYVEEYAHSSRIIYNDVNKGIYKGKDLLKLQNEILMNDCFFEWKILPHLWNKAIKKGIIEKNIANVPDNITFGEDVACLFPCMMNAESVVILDVSPYHYRQRNDSMVRNDRELSRDNFSSIYNLLKDAFSSKDVLLNQLNLYMYFILLLKCYSCFSDYMPLFPFEKVKNGNKVYVYGAGGFGSVIVRYIEQSSCLELAGWADQNASIIKKENNKIELIENIYFAKFDCIVIAILNESLAEKIKLSLMDQGISEKKIDYVKKNVLKKSPLPDFLLYEA